jgi:hypothetical protein
VGDVIQLPHKLSDLAQIALDDVMRIRSLPGYRINMNRWHELLGGSCAVCAAGAVIANRLSVDRESDVFGVDFDKRFGAANAKALLIIDELRSGAVGNAKNLLGASDEDAYSVWANNFATHQLDRNIVEYHEDPEQWRSDMLDLIADLRQAGL